MGASRVVMTDMIQRRTDKAMECGADDIILVTADMSPQDVAKLAEEKLGCMPDITIECTGAEPCIQVRFTSETEKRNCVDRNLWHQIRRLPAPGRPR